MTGSTVPAALDALIDAFTGIDADLEAIDGLAYDPAKNNFVCVGWDQGQDDAVSGVFTPQNAALSLDFETFNVVCLLSSWAGTKGTPQSVREKAFSEFTLLRAAVAADRTLGGVVMLAHISEYALTPTNNGEGLMANIRFVVRIQATV